MMRAGAAVAVAVATLLVYCSADPHQEQDLRVGGHSSGDRYDDFRQKEDFEDLLRLLIQYDTKIENRNSGIGGTLPGRNPNTYENRFLGRGYPVSERDMADKTRYARYIDSLGGGNFVRTLDSIGGGNFVRNLDSLGGANFVKRTLDSIGGANFVKRTLDSIGGANFVKRTLDSIGGPNLVKRYLDSLGGGNFVRRQVDSLGGGNFV
ncbi:uncharacterized protein LOC112043571 isoform X1 [Bicyclus anynana]|uniref:Uncharacterized protein LOC112043571 isoform X1 n=1 Tax=Bicyclus anynana TaxID=110368 RepID=A0A6J1MPL9_BICAN|nr:uncharacterized protein LOC112043571 isoform X1 [Bicyclus anynana]